MKEAPTDHVDRRKKIIASNGVINYSRHARRDFISLIIISVRMKYSSQSRNAFKITQPL